MDTKNLQTFIQVAELRSFTKAAEKLGYTQSTVSFQIRQLETELGVPLFDRINRTVSLTEYGSKLLQNAHDLSRLLQSITVGDAAPEQISGRVRLAMADSLCTALMSSVFPDLRSRYPGITLEICAAGTEEMFRLLNHNEVDLVCTMDSHIYDREYVILHEKRIDTHFVCGSDSPLSGRPIPVEQLVDQTFLLTEKNMSYRKLLDEQLASRSLEIQPVLECGNISLLLELTAKNAGLSFLPDFVTASMTGQGRIRRIEVPDLQVDVWVQLLHHRDKWLSDAMQVVVREISQALDSIR